VNRTRLLALLTPLAPTTAFGEPSSPVAVFVGLGVRTVISSATPSDYQFGTFDHTDAPRLAVDVHVALRVSSRTAIGVHAGIARQLRFEDVPPYNSSEMPSITESTVSSFDVGLALQYEPWSRVWAAPWLGTTMASVHSNFSGCTYCLNPARPTSSRTTTMNMAYGAAVGYDVICKGVDCASIFAAVEKQVIQGVSFWGDIDYTSLTFGVAYRR
jgi:hypothetical protein